MSCKQERKCVCCREIRPQFEMLRVARIDGQYVVDHMHKLGGRGAYVCKSRDCIDKTIKKRLFNKSFKTNISEDLYIQLKDI